MDDDVLPTLTLADIPKNIEFTDSEERMIGPVKASFFDQPTNGISYIRVKVNLKNLPADKRLFLPMVKELLPSIGTKNFKYDEFNNKILNCSSGIQVTLDSYCDSEDYEDILDRKE